MPAVTEPDGGLPTLRAVGGTESPVRAEDRLLPHQVQIARSAMEDFAPPSASFPVSNTRCPQALPCPYSLFPEVPICQNSTPPSRLHSNAKSTRKASQALLGKITCCFFGVSRVVPITASGRYYMSLCTHVSCFAACLPREWGVGGSSKTPPAPSSSQMNCLNNQLRQLVSAMSSLFS